MQIMQGPLQQYKNKRCCAPGRRWQSGEGGKVAIAAAALALKEPSEGGGDIADVVSVGAECAAQLCDVGPQLA